MATAEQLTARIERLKAARGSGVLTVRHGDESTTFRTVEEINSAIAADERELADLTRSGAIVRRYNFIPHKGL